jgi:hypothetical protein
MRFTLRAQILEARRKTENRLPEEQRSLFRLDRIGMWTKLRPAVRSFLAATAPLFELWVYTNGTRYANAAAPFPFSPSKPDAAAVLRCEGALLAIG